MNRDDDYDEDAADLDGIRPKAKYRPAELIGFVALMLVLFGVGFYCIYSLYLSDSPEAAFNDFVSAAEKNDGARMWDRMDRKTQEGLSKTMLSMKGRPEGSKYLGKNDRDMFAAITTDDAKDGKGNAFLMRLGADKPTVESSSSSGDSGSVVFKLADGHTQTTRCIKEDGRWRLQLSRGDL